MGNCHKLVQVRPAQNGVEGEVDLRNVEDRSIFMLRMIVH
jgi:hypothetical protein